MNPGATPIAPLQFAVVREDPRVELELCAEGGVERALLVASGGCTALALLGALPALRLTLVDPNPAQLAHVEHKLVALGEGDLARLGVGSDAPAALHECGNFERLFSVLRQVLDRFVLPAPERRTRLEAGTREWGDVTGHPYWPVAFELAFAEPFLITMFGPDAVQHAPRGSYPAYFRRRIEAGLAAEDVGCNPWLHHLLLGCYLAEPEAWPPWLRRPPAPGATWEAREGSLLDVPSFEPYDLVDLSNVLDWTDDAGGLGLVERLRAELRPGAAVLWRQLNDPRPLPAWFERGFRLDSAADRARTRAERSLFYDAVHVARRVG